MNISLISIAYLILKALLIKAAVEVCRYIATVIYKNQYPEQILFTHSNPALYWIATFFETVTVVTLLYLKINVYAIIGITVLSTYLVTKVGEYFINLHQH